MLFQRYFCQFPVASFGRPGTGEYFGLCFKVHAQCSEMSSFTSSSPPIANVVTNNPTAKVIADKSRLHFMSNIPFEPRLKKAVDLV